MAPPETRPRLRQGHEEPEPQEEPTDNVGLEIEEEDQGKINTHALHEDPLLTTLQALLISGRGMITLPTRPPMAR